MMNAIAYPMAVRASELSAVVPSSSASLRVLSPTSERTIDRTDASAPALVRRRSWITRFTIPSICARRVSPPPSIE